MARRKKKLTLEEELLGLEQEAEKCEDEIEKLKGREEELKQLIERKRMEALYQAVTKSGKSIEEVIALLEEESQSEEGQGEP